MDAYSQSAHQELIKNRLRSRKSGFVPFDLSGNETIPQMFARQVQLHGHKSAIFSDGKSVTYEELNQVSCDIGCTMHREAGADRTPIAIVVSQHISFAASLLAVLKSGRLYIPIDPSFPESRNSRILRTSNARHILTDRANQKLAERLALPGQALIYVDEVESVQDHPSDESKPDDLASVIFTSGSTGQPKGVMQTHRNVLQVVRRYTNCLYLGAQDRVSLLASCSVTASVATLLGALLNGATLSAFSVLEGGLNRLADWLDSEQITLYDSAPSLFRHLMKSVWRQRRFSSVQIVRLVSDSTYKSDWELFTQHCLPDSILVNNYGCSEMSTVSSFYLDAASRLSDGTVPVGYPLSDVEILVMGPDGLAVSINELEKRTDWTASVGEIVLKSRYLSPGYWNDPVTTDAAFTPVESEDGVRLYRTGDIGVVREGQGLVHLGRGDSQVKLSGFRVEIAEVEACLRGCPGVKEAAVVVHTPNHGERELIGFVENDVKGGQSGSEIRLHVQGKLPAHMVPSEVVVIDQMPCTPNGKVDRSALIKLRDHAWTGKVSQLPQTLTEEVIAEIWAKLLKREHVGVEDNFFALGGNSLLGMRLVSSVSESFTVELGLIAIFEHPTIREISQLVENMQNERLEVKSGRVEPK